MMSVRSVKNQYRGINAHLHSYWQHMGGWDGFHGNHIADLMRVLRAALLPMGYTAEFEPSLQIRRLDQQPTEPESDLILFDTDLNRVFQETTSTVHAGVLVLPISEALAEAPLSEKQFGALAIYELSLRQRAIGEPVAWIELLSPSNKGSSQDAETYREKRSKVLHSGLVFVELDYLHESPPTFQKVVDYRIRQGRLLQSGSHPYRIAVVDPRPAFAEGSVYITEFDVDDPIPAVSIPLTGSDVLTFDFGKPYSKTLEETLYAQQLVDYSRLPERFDRYSPDDQTRIAARMLAVIKAAQRGEDLEKAGFPVEALPLDVALVEIEVLTNS